MRCDFETPGGPWTVVQRRVDSSVDFSKTYQNYIDGFNIGDDGNQWIGLKNLKILTSQTTPMQFRVALCKTDGLCLHAAYDRLTLGNAASKYKLESVGTFLGGGLGDGKYIQSDAVSKCSCNYR